MSVLPFDWGYELAHVMLPMNAAAGALHEAAEAEEQELRTMRLTAAGNYASEFAERVHRLRQAAPAPTKKKAGFASEARPAEPPAAKGKPPAAGKRVRKTSGNA